LLELLAIWTLDTLRGVRYMVTMKNDSVQEPVKDSVMLSACKGELSCRMYSQ